MHAHGLPLAGDGMVNFPRMVKLGVPLAEFAKYLLTPIRSSYYELRAFRTFVSILCVSYVGPLGLKRLSRTSSWFLL
jgi:hypothetical protein